ncbi:hypothetical protein I3842_14G118600 [Carya illinoinensis]|uniref:Disease resistance RPP13-like protein 1 n=1 Tax=Carya illinoinensis TaxID=32201 RepID=A0A922ALI3_CARIL|nr:hypothetical protein I3842_14G118600 [Carya illinoinensis]
MAELVGGILLAAFLKVLFDRMASHEFVDFLRGRKLSDGLLDKLKTELLSIEVVLEDAEDKQVTNPSVKKWLDELKHAVYDAEDVLDEIATKALQSKLNAELGTTLNKKIEVSIKGVLGRLENLATSAVGKKPSDKLPTTSLVEDSEICGRHDDKDEIINKLLLDYASDNKIGVIVIVGMGGLGKTTLTQLVYNDKRVQKHFDLVAWVCVSEEFDMFKVMKTILEVVTSSTSDNQDLNRLQLQVNERLMGKKFLLTLHDIWNMNYTDWETLSNPFKSGAKGSRIIVTTRDLVVASVMRAFVIHHLKKLQEEHCWELFARHAFHDAKSYMHSDFGATEEEGPDACRRLPWMKKVLAEGERAQGRRRRVLGGDFPNWVGDHSFSNVMSIHLEKCKYCCSLPALGQLPCLQNLSIVGFDGIVAVGEEFYRSSSSSIKPFGALKKWTSFGAENEGGAFHRLEELYIWGCSKLMADLPIHLPSLGILEIIDCPKMLASLPRAPVICELKLANCREDILRELPIHVTKKLTIEGFDTVDMGDFFSHMSLPVDGLPSTLRTLEINNCKKLGLPTNLDYSCLQVLYLFGCDSLRSIPMDLFLNDKDLKIRSCTDLESLTSLRSLPDKMHMLLPSLTRIFILWCANIETLPEGALLSRLNKIDISFCEKLVESWMGWSLQNLASLRKFNISGGLEDVVSFTKKGLLPTNLINLRISDFQNLTSFDKNGFENLNSLESLTIVNCPKLDCMLEEGLQQLTSLSDLRISLYCPLMKRWWQRIKERKRMAQAACSHPLQISS